MSDFLDIYIKTLNDGGFQFCRIRLVRKVLEATGMEHCNGLQTPTKVGAPHGTDVNGFKAKIDWPNSYASVIRDNVVFSIKHKTRYILHCSPVCSVYT